MRNGSDKVSVLHLHGERSKRQNEKSRSSQSLSVKEKLVQLPTPILKIRDISNKTLTAAIQQMFDHVDDALFELADRAENNLEQNLYFESMREIRIHRRNIEQGFVNKLDFAYAILHDTQPKTEESIDDVDAEELSVVSKDKLEELVAVDSMVSKSWAHNKAALRHLTLRVDSLVNADVSEKNLPASPRVIADGFVEATQTINVDIKAKLVLFKLFERHVFNQLSKLLDELNVSLTELGVPAPSKPKHRQQSPQHSSGQMAGVSPGANHLGNTPQSADVGQGLYETLQSLIKSNNSQRSASYSSSQYASLSEGDYGVTELPYQLINALSQLQLEQVQDMPVGEALLSTTPQLLPIESINNAIRGTVDKNLDERSNNVIKLVDMLFSFILDDRNLPDPIKLLLSKLQIPFIKIALADDDFFKKDGHSARRLLNEMATASIGWAGSVNDNRKDPLLQKIESVVERVLVEFDSNFELFTILLTDFVAFVEKERRRALLFEKRAINAEDGKAKAEVARQQVAKQLDSIVGNFALPTVFEQLIQGPWSNILFLIYMRQGVEGQQWRQAMNIVEKLVWSTQPIADAAHYRTLEDLIPKLQSALKKGLNNISFSAAKQKKLFHDMDAHYDNLLDDYLHVDVRPNDDVASDASGYQQLESLDEELKNVDELIDQSISETSEPENAHVEPPVVADKLQSGNDHKQKGIELADKIGKLTEQALEAKNAELIVEQDEAQNTEIADPVETQSESPSSNQIVPEQQYLNLVDNFVVGVWFEKHGESASVYRCRLAAIIRGSGKYIFVNRAGMKVAEENREDLAMLLQTGQMRTLDDSTLFDRALESLISNLRDS